MGVPPWIVVQRRPCSWHSVLSVLCGSTVLGLRVCSLVSVSGLLVKRLSRWPGDVGVGMGMSSFGMLLDGVGGVELEEFVMGLLMISFVVLFLSVVRQWWVVESIGPGSLVSVVIRRLKSWPVGLLPIVRRNISVLLRLIVLRRMPVMLLMCLVSVASLKQRAVNSASVWPVAVRRIVAVPVSVSLLHASAFCLILLTSIRSRLSVPPRTPVALATLITKAEVLCVRLLLVLTWAKMWLTGLTCVVCVGMQSLVRVSSMTSVVRCTQASPLFTPGLATISTCWLGLSMRLPGLKGWLESDLIIGRWFCLTVRFGLLLSIG